MTKKQDKIDKVQLTYGDRAWLLAYLDSDNPETFFKGAASARAAGHDAKYSNRLGTRYKKKLLPVINKWLEEEGLDDVSLKGKLVSLLNAKETKFFQYKSKDKDIKIEEREVEALNIQANMLKLAYQSAGLVVDRHEHTGKDGEPLQIDNVSLNEIARRFLFTLVKASKNSPEVSTKD